MAAPSSVSSRDLVRALDATRELALAGGGDAFVHAGVRLLPTLVASELTLMSACDAALRHRMVSGIARGTIGARVLRAFDRLLPAHPLVAALRRDPRPVTWRMSDALAQCAFRRTALYAECYRPLGLDQVMVVPLSLERGALVSFVLHRAGAPFGDAERALLERIRPQLAALYRLSRVGAALARPEPGIVRRAASADARSLTRREREVLRWVAAGKTNRDVAAIVGASPRTIEKHLEHVYEKLGVETRTAAAMRASGVPPPGPRLPGPPR